MLTHVSASAYGLLLRTISTTDPTTLQQEDKDKETIKHSGYFTCGPKDFVLWFSTYMWGGSGF